MLGKLARITKAVELAEDQRQALNIIVENVCFELDVEVCSIYLADYDLKQFTLMATQGLNPKYIGQLKIEFNNGLVGLVGQREEPIHLHSANSHPAFHYVADILEDKLSAYLGVPIIHQRKVLGVLSIQQEDARQFEIDEETFLITLATQVSSVILNTENNAIIDDEQRNQLVRCINGTPASSGVVIGKAKVVFPSLNLSSISKRKTNDIPAEIKNLRKAVKRTHLQLEKMSNRMKGLVSDQERSLFEAYQQILGSAGIEQEVELEIKRGFWAPYALKRVIYSHLKAFQSMEDPYLQERALDIEDLANRVLGNLLRRESRRIKAQPNTILVTETISASMIAELPIENICAIVSLQGSATSHAAILAKALGIPSIMGLDPCQISRLEGKEIIIDAYNGQIFVSPNETLLSQYQQLINEEKQFSQELKNDQLSPNCTKDGVPISLMVNTSHPMDFEKAMQSGANGIGLYRTEIPFMHHQQFPSEQTQVNIYRNIIQGFDGMPVTIRTLDIGGDKQLPYFKIDEDNPFLGWRGVRVTLDHPEIFLVQLRAILKASFNNKNLKIAIPMIATVSELDDCIRLINQAFDEIEEETQHLKGTLFRPDIGIIIEVPSIVFQLKEIIRRVDFVSVGTNDLIQYLLAVDRNNLRLRGLYNHFQPAVLKILSSIIERCHDYQVDVQVCGEMASDPLAAIVLVGLGYRELSMNAGDISRVKRALSRFTSYEMERLSHSVLQYETVEKIKSELILAMEQKSLTGLIRAGR
ncbi:MAG: phosphoenolpyruvate--protein phosphotransferase [Kangiellaceae bacterium]|nr:phosphoenolpyruvate--protein phosphotransferase [Kangiellaceae bacterium]